MHCHDSNQVCNFDLASFENFCKLEVAMVVMLYLLDYSRELAIQIHNEARKFAQGSMVKSVVAYGGTSVFYQASQLQRGCNILVATPGR